jgi:hypothetical protein
LRLIGILAERVVITFSRKLNHLEWLNVPNSPFDTQRVFAVVAKDTPSADARSFQREWGSTLRLTLGCLLSKTLNITLRRVGSGRRHTFTNPGEIILDAWMAQHARVAWAAVEEPWLIEKKLLITVPLPLNLRDNTHPL